MHISSKGQYALLTIFDLASETTGKPVKIASIAQRQAIPQKFLELILLALKQAGFVDSHRGASGGYTLARPPAKITVGEVLAAFDGPPKRAKGHGGVTPFSELWTAVDKVVADIVDGATFAAIVREWEEKQKTYIHDWEI